ncbi:MULTISPECIES: hypothetical protein [unclassified Acidovorax]|uniref:hypothetical protein n=1 Tax=unclassified Acidovorax TaxID=2684926 RepID=UPI000AB62574|nr:MULTISPECIES: hypothetical protein [unclassified Acidovorax]
MKKSNPGGRAMSAAMECLSIGGIGATLIWNGWRFLGVCIILAGVAIAVWIMLAAAE